MSARPNCTKCKHYYVTWDKDCPKGCKAYKIKTFHMPSIVVKESSGEECQAFELKGHLKDISGKKKVDFNDDDLW